VRFLNAAVRAFGLS